MFSNSSGKKRLGSQKKNSFLSPNLGKVQRSPYREKSRSKSSSSLNQTYTSRTEVKKRRLSLTTNERKAKRFKPNGYKKKVVKAKYAKLLKKHDKIQNEVIVETVETTKIVKKTIKRTQSVRGSTKSTGRDSNVNQRIQNARKRRHELEKKDQNERQKKMEEKAKKREMKKNQKSSSTSFRSSTSSKSVAKKKTVKQKITFSGKKTINVSENRVRTNSKTQVGKNSKAKSKDSMKIKNKSNVKKKKRPFAMFENTEDLMQSPVLRQRKKKQEKRYLDDDSDEGPNPFSKSKVKRKVTNKSYKETIVNKTSRIDETIKENVRDPITIRTSNSMPTFAFQEDSDDETISQFIANTSMTKKKIHHDSPNTKQKKLRELDISDSSSDENDMDEDGLFSPIGKINKTPNSKQKKNGGNKGMKIYNMIKNNTKNTSFYDISPISSKHSYAEKHKNSYRSGRSSPHFYSKKKRRQSLENVFEFNNDRESQETNFSYSPSSVLSSQTSSYENNSNKHRTSETMTSISVIKKKKKIETSKKIITTKDHSQISTASSTKRKQITEKKEEKKSFLSHTNSHSSDVSKTNRQSPRPDFSLLQQNSPSNSSCMSDISCTSDEAPLLESFLKRQNSDTLTVKEDVDFDEITSPSSVNSTPPMKKRVNKSKKKKLAAAKQSKKKKLLKKKPLVPLKTKNKNNKNKNKEDTKQKVKKKLNNSKEGKLEILEHETKESSQRGSQQKKSRYNFRQRTPRKHKSDTLYKYFDLTKNTPVNKKQNPTTSKKQLATTTPEVKNPKKKRARQTTLDVNLKVTVPANSPPVFQKKRRRNTKVKRPSKKQKLEKQKPSFKAFFEKANTLNTPTKNSPKPPNTPRSSSRIVKRRSLSCPVYSQKKLSLGDAVSDSEGEPNNSLLIENTAANTSSTTLSDSNTASIYKFIQTHKKKGKRTLIGEVVYEVASHLSDDDVFVKLADWMKFICTAELKVKHKEKYIRKEVQKEHAEALKKEKNKKTKRKKKKKKVGFCSFDLSAIPPPTMCKKGKPKMSNVQTIVLDILTTAGTKASAVFNEKTLDQTKEFYEKLDTFVEENHFESDVRSAARHVRSEFKLYLNGDSHFPFQTRLIQLQYSHIRHYLKTIYNCTEFALGKIPNWVFEFGSWVDCEAEISSSGGGVKQKIEEEEEEDDWFLDQKEKEEKAKAKKEKEKKKEEKIEQTPIVKEDNGFFQCYHGAELAINLRSYHLMVGGEVDEEIVTFFVDFFTLGKPHPEILGKFTKKRKNGFQKYLFENWEKLKATLKELKNTRSEELYHFLPLYDFYGFLKDLYSDADLVLQTTHLGE